MNGLMMDWPLLVPSILRRRGAVLPGEGGRQPLGRRHDPSDHLRGAGGPGPPAHERPPHMGIQPGDRVATSPGKPSPPRTLFRRPVVGAVLHTINFRLSREQLRYIINHARIG